LSNKERPCARRLPCCRCASTCRAWPSPPPAPPSVPSPPLGEYGETFSGGFTAGLKLDFGLLPFLDTSLNVTYVEGTVKENERGIPTTEMNSVVPVFLQAKLKLPGFVAPYLLAGLGLYFYSLEYTDELTQELVDSTGAKFGYNAGLGVEISFLGFMGAYADGTYHWADSQPVSLNTLTF